MKNRICLFFFCLLSLLAKAHAAVLSPQATVSLVTVWPGKEVYDSFGHTAIWIYDPQNGIDKVYGYGTYDFNAPNFYGKFVRGQLNYMISIMDMNYFLGSYQAENRTVIDQILNLSLSQKEEMYAFLEKNYLPENRFYKYDFFFDNCTSRVRDVLKTICGNSLHFSPPTEKRSFRQWIDLYLQEHDWADFGMDLGLGDLSDRVATPYESMFLPQNLLKGLEHATLTRDGKAQPLVLQTRTLFQASPEAPSTEGFSPIRAFWLFFIIVALVTGWQIRKGKTGIGLDKFLFFVAGVLGWVLVFLWFGTDHGVTRNNWNLAWAWPLHLFVAFLLGRKTKPSWLAGYLITYILVTALLLVGWKWWPQELDAELIPLVLILNLRAIFRYFHLKRPIRQTVPTAQ
jgi:hypothetical protein